MVLVNMVAPLIKFAGEPEETTVSTNTIEGTSTNQGEKPEGISNESENDTEETKQSEEPQTEKTTDENQTGENKKDEETKEESKETTTTEETKETNNSEEEKTTSSGDTPKVTAIKDYTAIIKVLESKIEPMEKKTVEVKEKNDEYEINSFVAQFVSGAKEDTNGNLVWTPSNSAEGHEFTFRVNYAISGLKELPAGAIQITIPKSILRNREGKLDDYFVMSLPKGEEYDGTTEFAYMEDEEYLVIYNPEEVAAGINGYFEVAYATNSETYEYKDYDKENTKTILEGGTASDPFYAIITVQAGEEETLATISDDEHVYINTTAKIVSTQKRYPSIYRSWNSSWMKETPEDSDEYYYLVWEIRTYIASNTTQRYNFSLNDVIKDLTKELEGTDYQLVGYKMSGEKYYSDKNTQENLENEGYRYDYVLTRHKIETYKDIEYQLKNTITAVVDPVDQVDDDTKATSSNTFSWDPGFVPPNGHFNLFKYGNNTWYNKFKYYWDYANYDLDKFQKNEMEELEGFKYFTETIGYAYPWTLKEGGSSDNPEDYGVNPVTYDTWDDSLYLEGDTEPMNTEDYYLDYLIYSITNKDAKYDEFSNKFATTSANYAEDEDIIFYGKFKDSEDWIEIGTYNLSTNKLTKNDEYVEEITTNKIVFKENVHCTGWRFTTTNKHYYTYITVTPYFVLTHSSYVDEKVENKDSIKIQNNVSTNITNYKGETIFEKETSAIDYARVTYYDSQITKKVSAVSNNVSARTNTITWKVNVWETATSGKGVAEYIKQDSGIFYDLIPLGGEIDLNSVQVSTNTGYLAENEYSYEVVANYKNSGRTLLIVRINEQAEYYTVYYNTVHSWDSIQDYGRNVLNPVAYETGNEKITHGYADNGGNLSEGNKSLFTNLDETTDDKKFIYAEQTYNINILTAAISGLYKKVKNAEEILYSYETEVEPEGTYTYQLRYQNTFINQSKNLILFDSLENFVIVDSETGTTESSGWRGTLKSVDLSQLTKRGIDAKLYVSTVEKLDLEANNDITDTKIWKKANEDTDLSKVKAIAIDMTKGTDGEDYILGAGESVTAVLYMKAPAEVTEEIEKNPYTYNNIYIQNTLIDILGGIQNFFIHQDYTKVKYHVIADVNFYKVNAEDLEETIKGITFRLYGTSKYGTEVDKYVTSDKNGYVNFKDIEAGEYILQEYAGTPDWVEDHTEHRVKITNTREVYIDEKLVTEEEPVTIENTPRIYTNITFTKRNLVTNGLIEGAKFKLSGTSKYGTETLMYAISTQDGTVLFEDLEYGTYEMIEVEVPKGYILNRDTYRVVVDENGNYDILQKNEETEKYETIYSKGKYNIYNEPLHSFRIVKRDNYSEKAIQGAKFKLFGISDYGNSYNKEIESTVAGFVDFTGLEPGTYILQETYVPEVTDKEGNVISYILDETQYPVEIKKDGTVTIDGIEQNENGNFEIYNKRNKGQITITKKWVDDSNNDERPEPTIYISTEKPTESKFQYFRNNYSSSYGPLYYVDSNYKTKITGSFARNTTLSESEVVALGATRIDIEYDDPAAEYKIYGWIDDEGNFWWWSNAEVALMTDNSNKMFYEMRQVTSIDTTGIKTSDVTNMSHMFFYCDSLTGLDLSNFDTSKVTDMSYMFAACPRLKRLDIRGFDTSNVIDLSYIFAGGNDLTELDVSNFDTSKVKNMAGMFVYCQSLTEIDVSNFDTSQVTNMCRMFSRCYKLSRLNVSNFNTTNVTDMSWMLHQLWEITELDVSNFDTSKVTDMSYMFCGCKSLTELDVSNFNTSKVTNMYNMFGVCNDLTRLNLSNFDTSKVTNMSYMFANCMRLKELDVSSFDTSKVTTMSYMFGGSCQELTKLDLSNFDTSNVTDMSYMFQGDGGLKTIYASEKFVTTNVTKSSNMFLKCINLVGGLGTKYSSSLINKAYARIDKEGQPGYFTYKASTVSFVNDEEKIVVAELNVLDKIKLIKSTEKVSLETNNFTSSIIETMNNMAIETANLYNETLTYSTADTNYDDQGNEIKWVKNGDIWTYTFYVDDPNATWYIWEEDIEGYETNYTSYFPGTVENQKATVVNIKTDEDSDSDTSSDYEEPKLGYGNLKITKKLIGNTELTKEDDNTEFTFTVTLTAKEGQESLISGIKAFGEYVFKDGVGTVKIRAGETATLSNIPAGVSCKITEEEILGYDCFSGASVTISKDRTTSITATNFKDMSVDEGEKEEKTTSFTVAKEVTGNYEVEKSFNFEISLNNLKPDTTYYLSNENSFTSDSDGNADVSVTLKNGESVTVKDIPVGSKYKVYEHAGEYISSYVITDANDVGLINNTADRNTKENIAISTKLETADEGEDITITFTNEKNVKQNLKLTKEVTDENDKNSYIFTIEFANMEEKTEFNSTVGKVTADSQGKAELTIYLAGGEEAEFYDIPVGTTYKITELASSAIASYKITDKNGTNQIVQQTGANGEAKLDLSTKKETINEGEEAIVTFINDTVNQEPDSVSVSLGITKNVLNIKGEVLEDCEETFTFEVKPENEENPMPENKEIKVKGNGTESFGTITFTKTGTYKYKITEKAGELDYYNYDDAEYEIVYEVTNQEGLLEVTKTIKKDGFINDVIIFTNQISKVDVKILKTDENRKELPGAKLQILDAEGNIVKEWTTEETEHTIKLAVGTYTLREKEAPEKYEKAEDIIFVVNKDGTISVKGEKVDIIVMEDAKIQEKPIDENIEKEQEKITEKTEETITGDDIISFFISLMIATIIFALTIKEYRTKE